MPSKKQFKLYSKKHNAFQRVKSLLHSTPWTAGTAELCWKTFASIVNRIEVDLCNRTLYSRSKGPIDFDKLDDLEIVEYQVILKEVARHSVKDIIIERERERMIRSNLGYQVCRMYQKMKEEGLQGFRYIIVFNDYTNFEEAKNRLKELDIVHGKHYRYTYHVMIFNNRDDAIFTRLSFADVTSDLYDLETLKKIEVEEDNLNRAKTTNR